MRRPDGGTGGATLRLTYSPYLLPLFASCAMLIALLVIAWRSRNTRASGYFALTVAALLVWTVGFIFELASPSLSQKLFWANVQYVGIASLPVLWLHVVLEHLGRDRFRWSPLLWLVPIATVVLAWTDPGGVFYITPTLVAEGLPLPMVDYDYGPWVTVVNSGYALALGVAAVVLLARSAQHEQGERRWQSLLLLAATVLPLLSTGLYLLDVAPFTGYNPTAAVFCLSGAIMAVALFRFRLFDVAPLAREMIVEHMPDPVLVLDARDRLADFNRAALQLLPELGHGDVGRPIELVLEDHPDLLDHLDEDGTTDIEVVIRRRDEDCHYSLELSRVHESDGTAAGRVAVFHDITERVVLFERVKELASLDGLTGVFNRRHFFELSRAELNRARRHRAPISLILFDLDHFKQINDTHGHVCGDQVLRAVADACADRLRSFDLLGRYGGEEFAVLLPDIGPEGALAVAERLRRGIAAAAGRFEGMEVTASFGVASVLSAESATFDDLVILADEALYRAKGRGRDRVEQATCLPAPDPVVG